jgi:hypothetical protein
MINFAKTMMFCLQGVSALTEVNDNDVTNNVITRPHDLLRQKLVNPAASLVVFRCVYTARQSN